MNQAQLATNAITWGHINTVMQYLASAQFELMRRQFSHDRSKLKAPEVSAFTEYTPKLKGLTYGSDEYKQCLAEMKPALDHHYAVNRHHPEFFLAEHLAKPDELLEQKIQHLEGIEQYLDSRGRLEEEDRELFQELKQALERQHQEANALVHHMNLFDVLEMICDWLAACQRHADGDIYKSLEVNRDRFSLEPQLLSILTNTVPWLANDFKSLGTQLDLYPRGAE